MDLELNFVVSRGGRGPILVAESDEAGGTLASLGSPYSEKALMKIGYK